MSFVNSFHKVVNRESLDAAEAQSVMETILDGQASTAAIAALLTALRMKGETPDELLGFARGMRGRAVKMESLLEPGEALVDTCGTGGDGACTFNISTAAAFVIAGAGVKVAKHGNRSISSRCGSADILEALGVKIDLAPDDVALCIRETGIGFLYAPALHPAVRHAQPARLELRMRTVFNLLGPLTNPAGASAQLVGAPSIRAAELMAQTLASLGLPRGFVVHGMDGLDEITITGETLILEIRSGAIAHHSVSPEDFGVPRAGAEDIRGDDPATNRHITEAVLAGEKGPRRDIVLVNAAAALVAAGKAANFKEGSELAAASIDTGMAAAKLEAMRSWTQSARQTQSARTTT